MTRCRAGGRAQGGGLPVRQPLLACLLLPLLCLLLLSASPSPWPHLLAVRGDTPHASGLGLGSSGLGLLLSPVSISPSTDRDSARPPRYPYDSPQSSEGSEAIVLLERFAGVEQWSKRYADAVELSVAGARQNQDDPNGVYFDDTVDFLVRFRNGSLLIVTAEYDITPELELVPTGAYDEYMINGPFLSLSAGVYHYCAIMSNLLTWCFSSNFGSYLAPWPIDEVPLIKEVYTRFTAVALGFEYTCGLCLSNAKVECYGINITMTREYESIAGVSSGSDVYKHTDALWKGVCGLAIADGGVYCAFQSPTALPETLLIPAPTSPTASPFYSVVPSRGEKPVICVRNLRGQVVCAEGHPLAPGGNPFIKELDLRQSLAPSMSLALGVERLSNRVIVLGGAQGSYIAPGAVAHMPMMYLAVHPTLGDDDRCTFVNTQSYTPDDRPVLTPDLVCRTLERATQLILAPNTWLHVLPGTYRTGALVSAFAWTTISTRAPDSFPINVTAFLNGTDSAHQPTVWDCEGHMQCMVAVEALRVHGITFRGSGAHALIQQNSQLHVSDCEFLDAGGAVWHSGGVVFLERVHVHHMRVANDSDFFAPSWGLVHIENAELFVTDSLFEHNWLTGEGNQRGGVLTVYHGTYPPGNALELTPRIKFTRSVWRNNSMTHRGYVGDGTGAFGGVCVQIYSTGCEAFFNECLIEGTRQNARWEQGAIAVFGNNRDNFWLETTVENSVFRDNIMRAYADEDSSYLGGRGSAFGTVQANNPPSGWFMFKFKNVLIENSAAAIGGALSFIDADWAHLTNVTILNCTASNSAAAIENWRPRMVTSNNTALSRLCGTAGLVADGSAACSHQLRFFYCSRTLSIVENSLSSPNCLLAQSDAHQQSRHRGRPVHEHDGPGRRSGANLQERHRTRKRVHHQQPRGGSGTRGNDTHRTIDGQPIAVYAQQWKRGSWRGDCGSGIGSSTLQFHVQRHTSGQDGRSCARQKHTPTHQQQQRSQPRAACAPRIACPPLTPFLIPAPFFAAGSTSVFVQFRGGGTAVVRGCEFTNNWVEDRAPEFNYDSLPLREGGAITFLAVYSMMMQRNRFKGQSVLPPGGLHACADYFLDESATSSDYKGGVLSVVETQVLMESNEISEASACSAAGIYWSGHQGAQMYENTFRDLSAYTAPAAVFEHAYYFDLSHSLVENTYALASAGAMSMHQISEPQMDDVVFRNTSCGSDGGAFSVVGAQAFHFSNLTFIDSFAPNGAGAIMFTSHSPLAPIGSEPGLDPSSFTLSYTDPELGARRSMYGPVHASDIASISCALAGVSLYAGSSLPPLVIEARDSFGQLMTMDRGHIVQVALRPGVGPESGNVSTARLSGVVLQRFDAGTGGARFDDLSVTGEGGEFRLRFSIISAPSIVVDLPLRMTLDCPAGLFYDQAQQRCRGCELDHLVYDPAARQCVTCPEGRIARRVETTGENLCVLCDLGSTSLNGQTCSRCGANTFQPLPGARCSSCLSEGMQGIQCADGYPAVDPGHFALSVMGEDGQPRLATFQCPEGFCTGGVLQEAWSDDGNGTSSSTSSALAAGPGGTPQVHSAITRFDQCAFPRRSSPDNLLCGECVEGYRPWGDKCVKCEKADGGMVFLLVLLSIALVLFYLYSATLSSTAGHSVIVLYFVQTAMLEVGSASNLIGWMNLALFSPNSIGTCIVPLSVYEQTMVQILMPLFLLAELAIVAAAHVCASRAMQRRGSTPRSISPDAGFFSALPLRLHAFFYEFDLDVYLSAALSLLLFCYTQVAVACLSFLFCVDVGGVSVVFTQPSMRCASSLYRRYLGLVLFAIVVFVAGFPLATLAFLWRHSDLVRSAHLHVEAEARAAKEADMKQRLSTTMASDAAEQIATVAAVLAAEMEEGQDQPRRVAAAGAGASAVAGAASASSPAALRFLRRYSPLFSMYSRRAWFWQSVVLARRSAFVAISVALVRDPASKFLAYAVAHLASLLLNIAARPFSTLHFNLAEWGSHALLLLISQVLIARLPPYPSSTQIALFCLILPPVAVYLVAAGWGELRARRRERGVLLERVLQMQEEREAHVHRESVKGGAAVAAAAAFDAPASVLPVDAAQIELANLSHATSSSPSSFPSEPMHTDPEIAIAHSSAQL